MARRSLILLFSLTAAGCGGPDNPSPGFDVDQAMQGKSLYAEQCASCHGAELQGGAGPALAGTSFLQRWADGEKPLAALYDVIGQRMPPQEPGSLSEDQVTDLIAHILSVNGYAAGDARLTRDAMTRPLGKPGESGDAASATRVPLLGAPSSPGTAKGTRPSDADIRNVAPGNWLTYNRDLSGQRYSPLGQITKSNAAKLRPECIFQLGEVGVFQAGPVVFDGTMYVTTARRTSAFDAATCRALWQHDHVPDGPEPYTSNRGVALYDGKVFRGTPDGHLIALDAATGTQLWDVRVADSALGQWIAAAPLAVDGRVIVGNAGGIFGANGHIHAFDADSGRRLWTFELIAEGVENWEKGSETGGGSSWTSFAYDPVRKLIYAPVGNPAPVFDGGPRPGTNLYTSSVVALDAVTGKLATHVQQTPHDTHDYDTAAAPLLFEHNGNRRMAVANKGGWLFIYDRDDGNRLIARQSLGRHENNDRAPGPEPMRMCPGGAGGAEWNGPAYSSMTRRLYVNAVDWCMTVTRKPASYKEGEFYYSAEFAFDPPETAFGTLRAFDADTGAPGWVYRSRTPMLAGVTPTAGGLIFTGDLDGYFLAIDESTGKPLYRFNTGGAIAGGVVSYAVGGRQFVAVASGNASKTWNSTGAATVVVFALPE